ncbi:MAG: VOC family protein [Chloroflexi bacterium]|nr:VOC family protein [Chloroflexota bacterium]
MSVRLSIVPIQVSDQQAALRWYTEKLGMEKIMDDPMGPELRWITVKLPEDEVQFVLANFGAFDPDGAQPGSSSGYVLWTDDIRATYEDWSGKGVEFSEPPTQQMWGHQALFQDPDGNGWVLVQRPTG